MKLAQITLPKGHHLYPSHIWLENQLIERWKGYTAHSAKGAWVDGGNGVFEEVIVYSVAMERADVIHFRSMAQELCAMSKEQCIMIVTPNGDVEFVKAKAETKFVEPDHG